MDGWKDAIADARRSMVSVGRALGEKGRDAVSAARRESENSLEVSTYDEGSGIVRLNLGSTAAT